MTDLDDRTLADLTALADGTLRGRRRARLEAEVARSPELQGALERQRRAVAALRSVEERAPASLRERVEAARSGRTARRGRAAARERSADRPGRTPDRDRERRTRRPLGGFLRSPAFAGGLAAGAAFALILALVLPGGAGGPSVVEAAELAERPAEAPAPRPEPGEPALLDARAEGLAYPNWAREFGWRAAGRRVDEIDGRRAVTVFYEKEGRRVGYTILSGEQLDPPDDSRTAVRDGTTFRGFASDGRLIVTWPRQGHTCVLSGEGVDAATLIDLAAWSGMGAVEV
jgi:hypothetical protein